MTPLPRSSCRSSAGPSFRRPALAVLVFLPLGSLLPSAARAAEPILPDSSRAATEVAAVASPRPHGPSAAGRAFPSHVFQLRPRWPDSPQLGFHFGLLQPVLFRGFNAAVDLRYKALVVTYSHGQGLDYSANPGLGLTAAESRAGMALRSPYTTGGGIGITVIDELHVLADFKGHRYEAALGGSKVSYNTLSIGAEIGWRYFIWRGLFVQPLLRFWPNVWNSLPGGAAQLGNLRHEAKNLGFFANVSLGWAFDVGDRRR